MVRRVVALALAASCITAATPAVAQGRAPRSPSDRQVDLRQGTPDLSFDSRMAGASPTPASETRASGWSDTATGGVMIGFGALFLAGSGITAGYAVDAASDESVDEAARDEADGAAVGFGIASVLSGLVGLGLVIPGIVFIANDDETPAATAHVGPAGGSIAVRF